MTLKTWAIVTLFNQCVLWCLVAWWVVWRAARDVGAPLWLRLPLTACAPLWAWAFVPATVKGWRDGRRRHEITEGEAQEVHDALGLALGYPPGEA